MSYLPQINIFFFTSNFLLTFVPWLVVIVWQFYVTPMNEIFRSMSSVKLTIKKIYPNFIKGVVKLLSSAIQKLILFNNKIIKYGVTLSLIFYFFKLIFHIEVEDF